MAELLSYSSFIEVAFLLILATAIGFLGLLFKQPLIVSFIAVGLLAGPSALDIVYSKEKIDFLSELGIATLLFLVGIKLDIKLIRSIGLVSIFTGLGQVIFTSLGGYLIGLALDFDRTSSLYIAIALTFSSTIIIVKLLSDKKEIDALHGQIALGFLIVQDIFVVLSMVILATIGIGSDTGDKSVSIFEVILSCLGLILFVVIFVRFIATPLTQKLANAPELLLIFSIAFAALFASTGELIGLGKEVGGLLAGIALASTPYRESIAARLAPLRDFLLLFFFIALGSTLDLSQLGNNIYESIIFSLFVLIGNPIIVIAIMGVMGYQKRTSFLAGLTVAQISEFSLIFIAMGITLGHVKNEVLGVVTLVGIITIALSTYMITYSHRLYKIFEPYLHIFEKKKAQREKDSNDSYSMRYDIIILGLGRFGTALAQELKANGISVLGIDFNPNVIKKLNSEGLDCRYGDATDSEFLSELPLRDAKWMISTVPNHHTGLSYEDSRKTIVQLLRMCSFNGYLSIVSHNSIDTKLLKKLGVHLVLEPFKDAAQQASIKIEKSIRKS